MRKILMMIFAVMLLASCSCGGSKPKFKHGQTVFVKEKCIWASNEETFSQMTKYCIRKDERGLELMESRGEVGILSAGEKGVITDMGFGKIKIRLDNDSEVWVATEFLN